MLQSRLSYWWLINDRNYARVTSLKKELKLKFNSGQLIPVYLPFTSLGVNLLASLFMFRHWSPVPSRSNCQIVNATRISTKTQLINNPNMVPRASPSLPLPAPPSDLPSYSDKKEIFSLIALCLWKDPAMEAKFAWSCFVILTIILDTKAILFLNKTFFR